jgi:hypothetical protein
MQNTTFPGPASPVRHAQYFAVVLIIVAYLRCGRGISQILENERYCHDRTYVMPYVLVLALLLNRRSYGIITLTIEKIRRRLRSSAKETLQSAGSLTRVGSREVISQLSRVGSLGRFSCSIRKSFTSRRRRAVLQATTATECFARMNYIEQLSVSDITLLFQYATLVSRANFDKKVFMAAQTKLIRAMVTAMDVAVTISRGGVMHDGFKAAGCVKSGDIDALYFVAAARVFAEWRNVRLVPEGYKRYAMALGLAKRDVLQNLVKVELAVHSYLKVKSSVQQIGGEPVPVPSLRQLLQHELENSTHSSLPYLAENSAASGILWCKRQIHYQEATFANIVKVPMEFPTSKDAGLAAYAEVYENYHGWTVKQIFSHSLGGTPPLDVLWRFMNPPPLSSSDASQANVSDPSMPDRKLSDLSDDTFSASMNGEKKDNELLAFLDNLNRRIEGEWNKAVRFVDRLNCVEFEESRRSNLIISHASYVNMHSLQPSVVDGSGVSDAGPQSVVNFASSAIIIDKVKEDIRVHVEEMQPLLDDLNLLLGELNMNDPTKV